MRLTEFAANAQRPLTTMSLESGKAFFAAFLMDVSLRLLRLCGPRRSMTDRVQAIRAMLQKSPGDVFLHYSLAKEYTAAGQHDQAVEEFRKCIQLEADYLPAYVEAGKCLRSAGRLAEARDMFLAGLDLAAAKGERHVRDFIQQQLDALPKPS
jgi:Flp pilus assembly protein TadD